MQGLSPDIILTAGDLKTAVEYFLTQDAFAFDTEAAGPNRGVAHLNQLTWISLATNGRTIVVPFGHERGSRVIGHTLLPTAYKSGAKTGQTFNRKIPVYEDAPPQIERDEVFDILRPLFFSRDIVKVAHNASFDLASVTKYYGETPPGPYDDTILLAWLIDENRRRLGLKYVIKELYGYSYDDEEVGRRIEDYPFDKVALYSYQDARVCWFLYKRFLPQIALLGLEAVHDIETRLLPVLVDMRLTGAPVDVRRMLAEKINLRRDLDVVEGRIRKIVKNPEFNINSTRQKQIALFGPRHEGGQGLNPWKLTKTGQEKAGLWEFFLENGGEKPEEPSVHWYSTDDEVLRGFPKNALAREILAYQEISKVLGTYILGYLGDKEDPEKKPCRIYSDRIHADFVQYGTVTGRFSCREPNLQNIPRPSSDLGRIIRGLWLAEPGHKLVVADFGQIELVVLAHYLGEGKLYDGFWAGIDPHRITAAGVLNKRPEDVTGNERQYFGKTLGFATVYGAGIDKIASMAQVSEKRAREILKEHRRQFPEIYSYREFLLDQCRTAEPYPHIRTMSGRMRRLPEINSRDKGRRMSAERQCFNSLIQGSAADIQKLAMIYAHTDPLMGDTIKMLMTVHDEIVLSAPEESTGLAVDILTEAMTGKRLQSLVTVPLSADVKIVNRWSEAK